MTVTALWIFENALIISGLLTFGIYMLKQLVKVWREL